MPDPITNQVATDPTTLIAALSAVGTVVARELIYGIRWFFQKRNDKVGQVSEGDNPHISFKTCEKRTSELHQKASDIINKIGYNKIEIGVLKSKVDNLDERSIIIDRNMNDKIKDIRSDIADVRSDIKDLRSRIS